MLVTAGRMIGGGRTGGTGTPIASPLFTIDVSTSVSGVASFTRADGLEMYNDSSGVLQVTGSNNTPAWNYEFNGTSWVSEGLLNQPSVTNFIHNPRCEGAASGTPGTLPTTWPAWSAGGFSSINVAATGTENGMPYVDIRFQSASNSNYATFAFDAKNSCSVSQYDPITFSVFTKLVAGSMANVSPCLLINDLNGAQSSIGNSYWRFFIPGSVLAPVSISSRMIYSGVAYAYPVCLIVGTNTGPIDITIRFASPQLENTWFRTSPVWPAPGARTQTTRAADNLVIATGAGTFDVLVKSNGWENWYYAQTAVGGNITVPVLAERGRRAVKTVVIYAAGALSVSNQLALERNYFNYKSPFIFGMNFSDGDDVPGRTTYGVNYKYPVPADFDAMNTRGIKLIRMAIGWEKIQKTTLGPLDPRDIADIHTALNAASARGMKVILDLHNFLQYNVPPSDSCTEAQLLDVWTRLATEFNGDPGLYAYGIMNEPGYGTTVITPQQWATWAQDTINTIRSIDTTTPIIYHAWWKGGTDYGRVLITQTTFPSDPQNKLILEWHLYPDGSGAFNTSGGQSSYDACHAYPTCLLGPLQMIYEFAQSMGVGLLIGEYAVQAFDYRWTDVVETFLTFCKYNNIPSTFWAYGSLWSKITSTSETSLTPGLGSMTFTNDTNTGSTYWDVNHYVLLTKVNDTYTYMLGTVTNHTGASVTANMTSFGGVGPVSTWNTMSGYVTNCYPFPTGEAFPILNDVLSNR